MVGRDTLGMISCFKCFCIVKVVVTYVICHYFIEEESSR